MDPKGASPKLSCTIYAVIVWMLSSGLAVNLGVAPAAIVTSIVSPIAREIANIKEAIIPDKAAGTTTRNAT